MLCVWKTRRQTNDPSVSRGRVPDPGSRKDTLFELLDAALVTAGPANLVHLSLASVFRRRWPSASDALADGRVPVGAVSRADAGQLAADEATPASVFAAGVGGRWDHLAAAGREDESGADLGPSQHAGHPAGWGGPGLGVRVAGRCARDREQLGAAPRCRAAWPRGRDADRCDDPATAGGAGPAIGGCGPSDPHAADRWTWLLALGLWILWLARPLVADQRLPWERPLPPARLTPTRVRRPAPRFSSSLGLRRPFQTRGKAPGRPPGPPLPTPQASVARRPPKRAALDERRHVPDCPISNPLRARSFQCPADRRGRQQSMREWQVEPSSPLVARPRAEPVGDQQKCRVTITNSAERARQVGF